MKKIEGNEEKRNEIGRTKEGYKGRNTKERKKDKRKSIHILCVEKSFEYTPGEQLSQCLTSHFGATR